jgi:hypothetical protein
LVSGVFYGIGRLKFSLKFTASRQGTLGVTAFLT